MNNIEKTLLSLWLLLSGAIALFFIFSYAQSLFIPLFIALLLTPFYSPAVLFLHKKKIPEVLGISLLILFSLLFLGIVFYLFVVFSSDLHLFILSLGKKAETFRQTLFVLAEKKLSTNLRENFEKIFTDNLETMSRELLSLATQTLGKTTSFLTHFLMTALYLFFLLTYRRKIVAGLLMLNPLQKIFPAYSHWQEIVDLTRNYIRGSLLVMIIMFLLLGSILWALRIPYPFLWSAVAAIANLIPYLGMTAAGLACASVSAIHYESGIYFIGIIVLFWAINIFENNIITPFFIGKSLLLNPLAILLGALTGYYFLGIIGSILIIPYLVILKHISKKSKKLQFIYHLLGE